MADFSQAYKLTGHNEGGYSFDPHDRGGETFAGISRVFWPAWVGWDIIDAYKRSHGGISGINSLLSDPQMQSAISYFYTMNFWDVNKLDQINDQQLANNVYDFGVNSGVGKAAKTLQKVVGVNVDGIVGNQTIAATNALDAHSVYDKYNAERTAFYNSLAQNPGQLQFLKSWMSRVVPYKS